MQQCKQSSRYKRVFEHILVPTGRLSEEESSVSKNVEDMKTKH
jgi:hypothetical protein